MIPNFAYHLHPRRNRMTGIKGPDDRRVHTEALFKVWVPFEEACMKVVEYKKEEFMFEFRHGHPMYKSGPDIKKEGLF